MEEESDAGGCIVTVSGRERGPLTQPRKCNLPEERVYWMFLCLFPK
jgi:hypothetical protein